MPTLTGNWWDDTIHADPGNYDDTDPQYFIYGYQGNDHLYGAGNDDLLDGGTGADFMYGDKGDDTYVVDNVGDVVREIDPRFSFFAGHDLIYSSISLTLPEFVEDLSLLTGAGAINGTGNDLENVIHGNESANTLQGLDGEDLIIGHDGNDTLRGGNHNDALHGNDGNDTLEGGDGEDELFGGANVDTLRGGALDDVLDGGTNADTMEGGGGNDTYRVDNSGDELVELSNQGADIAISTAANFTLGLFVETLVLDSAAGAINGTGSLDANTIVGNGSDNELRGENGNDILKGGGGADTLRGGNHNDELYGQGGNDDLRGDDGEDEMYGGQDDDTYRVNSAGDIVGEDPNEGVDTVLVFTVDDYTLTANVENLSLITGTNGTGNGLANTIIGNLLDNDIDGAAGIDIMDGRQGDDTYTVDNASDDVVEFANQGDDTVLASVSYTLGATDSVEHLATTNATGTGTINLTGNDGAQSITGNDGGNILNGRGGSDVLDGRGGIDAASYANNTARVVVVLGANGGPGQGMELNAQGVVVSVDTLFNIEEARGSNFEDSLVGVAANHVLRGGASNDTYFVHDSGVDVLEIASQGIDEVRSSVNFTLTVGQPIERLRTTDDAGTVALNLTGNAFANEITGNDGDNRIDGGFGNGTSDALIGRDGNDTYIVRNANDTITEFGGQGIDEVQASVSYTLTAGADVETLRTTDDTGTAALNLTGNASGNVVIGNNGSNVINGGGGNDELTGLGGPDSFLFNTALDAATNVDEITDFNVAADTIQLDDAVFSVFANGPLAAERFLELGTAVQDGSDNILYDRTTGALFYDSDAAGGAAPILFAEVTPGLALSNVEFLVV